VEAATVRSNDFLLCHGLWAGCVRLRDKRLQPYP
jgi:hypothetical protein